MVKIDFIPGAAPSSLRRGESHYPSSLSRINYLHCLGSDLKIVTSILVYLHIPRWAMRGRLVDFMDRGRGLRMTPQRLTVRCLAWEALLWTVAELVGVDEGTAFDAWIMGGDYFSTSPDPFPF